MLTASDFLFPDPSKYFLIYQLVFLTFSPPRVIQVTLLEIKKSIERDTKYSYSFLLQTPLFLVCPPSWVSLLASPAFAQHLPGETFDAIHSVLHDGWLNSSELNIILIIVTACFSKCPALYGSNVPTFSLSPDSSQFLQEGDIVPRRSRSAINCRNCNWPQSSDGIVRIPYVLDPAYGGFKFQLFL